ncbi:hypothetical protein [Vitiosangium sp. GDMCC 1.1324]|uniref:hypothetical protein n=1 Tax=Vitiosangium sp. (strain GDMCC 1.1324) TaxID=2138576 RepID=UPI0011B75C56|nr:hypothetical protein [Vitiosangium sp. GDMCC 1.1324]
MMDARQFAAVLEKLAGAEDSRLQQVLQLLTQRSASEGTEHAVHGRLRGERRRLARRRLDAEFAAACGACACFGAPHCPNCGGEGRPGWQVPDENLFRMYVAPALERLGIHHQEEGHATM